MCGLVCNPCSSSQRSFRHAHVYSHNNEHLSEDLKFRVITCEESKGKLLQSYSNPYPYIGRSPALEMFRTTPDVFLRKVATTSRRWLCPSLFPSVFFGTFGAAALLAAAILGRG